MTGTGTQIAPDARAVHGDKPAWWRRWARGMRRQPVLTTAGAVLLGLLAFGLLGPALWRHSPVAVDVLGALNPPSASHPMGTDGVGRDVLARFMLGARISMFVGAVVVVVGAALGGLVGLLAGVAGGWLDAVLMRLMDAILAFPPLVLAMAVTVGLGAGLGTAAIGVIVSALPWYARVVRSEVIRVKAQAFVESTYAIGASRTRLIARHIVPHVLPIVLIQAAAAFGSAVLALAALGFVGLGAQLPTPEWGAMITDGLQYTLTGEWWVGLFPGLGLLVAVTAASVLADRMRDVLDPRGEQSRG